MSEQDQGAEPTISDQAELETLREGIDDPMILKEQLKKEADARRQLTARAKKAEELLRELKTKPAPESVTNQPPTQASGIDDRVELRLQGYSKDEVETIMQNGGVQALQDPQSILSLGIKARREQAAAEKAASEATGTGSSIERELKLTDIPRNASLGDLRKSVAEMEAKLPYAG